MEYIFKFVNDVCKVWFSCLDQAVYKLNNNSFKFGFKK